MLGVGETDTQVLQTMIGGRGRGGGVVHRDASIPSAFLHMDRPKLTCMHFYSSYAVMHNVY